MKILFDNQIFHAQKYGGISRYICELIKGIEQAPNINASYRVGCTNNVHFNENKLVDGIGSLLPTHDFFGKKIVVKLCRPISYFQQLYALRRKEYDVFFPTYYNPFFLPYIDNKPFVLTVHDMIHELFPKYFPIDHTTIVANKKILIEKASKIIVVSQSTKKDILRIYPATEEAKIEVVYLSHSISETQQLKSLALPDKYILFVGSRAVYKNFTFFLKAVAPVLRANKELYVVCTGSAFTSDEEKMFGQFEVADQLVYWNAADDELKTLYSNALFFIFPSEYEGFGIPILEAMASACPVVASNASSFPEVAGDAALFFELNDQAGLTQIIERVVDSPEIRDELRQKGLLQVKKFSWDKTVAACIKICKSVAAQDAELK